MPLSRNDILSKSSPTYEPAPGIVVASPPSTTTTSPATTYRKTTTKTVNTTTTATDLLNGEITIAAGVMGTTGALRLQAWGDNINNSGGTAAPPRFQLILGGTTVFDTGATGTTTAADAVRRGWSLDATILNAGATNAQTSMLKGTVFISATAANVLLFTTGEGAYMISFNGSVLALVEGVNSSTAVDTTAAKLLELKVINGSASASYETKLLGALVEII